mgnify:CR=1 FL=1
MVELKTAIIYFVGWMGAFIAAVKIDENIKLKKEIKILKEKLGKI